MRNWNWKLGVGLLTVTTSLFGCRDDGAAVRDDVARAATSLKEYTFAQKNEFVKAVEEATERTDEQIERLEDKLAAATADAKERMEPTITTLRDRRAVLSRQIDEARQATAETWADVRERTADSYEDLKSFVAKAWADL